MPSGPRARVPDCHLWFPILFFVVLKEDKKKKKVGWDGGLDSKTSALAAGWLDGQVEGVAAPSPWACGSVCFLECFYAKNPCAVS